MNKQEKIEQLLDVLVDQYGVSDYQSHSPYIEFEDGDDYGYFDPEDNIITLSPLAFGTKEDLLRTLVHEYTHYLQDPKEVFTVESNIQAFGAEDDWVLFSDAYDTIFKQ